MLFRRFRKHRRQSLARLPRVAVESLEPRSLLSASLREGVLSITGGSGKDQILLSLNAPDADRLLVSQNGRVRSFELADVTAIVVNGRGGHDLIELDQGNGPIEIPTTLLGGNGNDTLIGGAESDRLDGGTGNDLLRGQAGDDFILGGVGSDDANGGNGDDTVSGDAGDDTLIGHHGEDSISGGAGDDLFHANDDVTAEIHDAGTGSDEIELTLGEAPTAIQDAVAAVLGDGTLTRLTNEFENGESFYDAEFEADGQTQSVKLSDSGDVLETAIDVDVVSLPTTVTDALRQRYRRGIIESAQFITTETERLFEVDLKVRGVHRELTLVADGTIQSDIVRPPESASAGAERYRQFTTEAETPFFILTIGAVATFEGVNDAGENEQLIVSVLDAVKMINGVETRIVEERHLVDGNLVEVSRNFVAVDRGTGNVYYFGEDVDDYEDGEITGHPGEWRDGVRGAGFGLLVPAVPRVGLVFLQERAPGVALDTVEILSTTATVVTPFGTFTNCVQFRETTPLEPGAESIKFYAPGIGLVLDDTLHLTNFATN